ncbi:hypothetical protein ACIBCM_14125 [Streptomyces sp. NPDC051018]|uniref:hypothetical protein n=1 Tax=Streptomyces sp. NPDC051018 TaxID=3365639 RepID=UPI0037AA9517
MTREGLTHNPSKPTGGNCHTCGRHSTAAIEIGYTPHPHGPGTTHYTCPQHATARPPGPTPDELPTPAKPPTHTPPIT